MKNLNIVIAKKLKEKGLDNSIIPNEQLLVNTLEKILKKKVVNY